MAAKLSEMCRDLTDPAWDELEKVFRNASRELQESCRVEVADLAAHVSKSAQLMNQSRPINLTSIHHKISGPGHLLMECRIAIAVFPVLLVIGTTMGCVDKHTDPNERERTSSGFKDDTGVPHSPRVKVNAPGVSVETDSAPLGEPGTERSVDVDVGPGGVRVDIDGKPVRERLRESRSTRPKTEARP